MYDYQYGKLGESQTVIGYQVENRLRVTVRLSLIHICPLTRTAFASLQHCVDSVWKLKIAKHM